MSCSEDGEKQMCMCSKKSNCSREHNNVYLQPNENELLLLSSASTFMYFLLLLLVFFFVALFAVYLR